MLVEGPFTVIDAAGNAFTIPLASPRLPCAAAASRRTGRFATAPIAIAALSPPSQHSLALAADGA